MSIPDNNRIKIAVEIDHIKKIYGRDGLILAMDLLKRILDKEFEEND